jgi:hypothetical protein
MANDRVTRIGCGMTTYKSTVNGRLWRNYLLACNYASTNIIGLPVYQSGPVADGCPDGADLQYPGLCTKTDKIDPNKL